ncbi:MAG: phosphate starvation-inducible protein PhoH [Bacteroidetes bacterium GWC2_33_15]|nr:MAG: phosphate starvation-inducible protein PhoH [Bacteroidetes bacterium GWA2_33_15]OFX48811.1 MAG: phosphate starvation-inducible protein PhoH [Bacteroidetes bacterium GWC2_33_15]OFX66053.1 MAG: phosphate starvation-inducible protein PhoH [Bacteroidetes bacterium GWB2_32_14]OFX68185.1 MAG: phosphate starvation-inducible protein PhoH [Bacteroidetes bacterium GWD2_33_33]HAN17960.1 ribonuclease [Bacteroidales bacterium]
MKKNKKVFVIDTNVILHDYTCLYNFQENDIVLPIVVLEELDYLKKGNDLINYHAREFTRELDKLSGDTLFNGGKELGKGLGKLSIETGKPFSDQLKASFPEPTPDHRILAIAEFVSEKKKPLQVILVSKDINLRMKAKSLGIMAQDYTTDKVADLEQIHKDIETIDNVDDLLISRFYEMHDGVPIDEFKLKPKPHQYYILKGQKSSALAHFDPINRLMQRVEKHRTYGIEPRNAEQTFSIDALNRPEIQLIALTGKAGTGKTLLALASALHQEKKFNQILLARPIVPLANRDMGFLPGDVKEKILPYMQPLFDNLSVIKNQFKAQSKEYMQIEDMLKSEKLVLSPLAYIRGRSLSNSFFIVDEAQNLTPHEIKTIITRAGEGTKMVFTGDIHQIDSPYLDMKSNGLSYLADRMKGQDIFAHVNLVKGERSYLAELASNLL